MRTLTEEQILYMIHHIRDSKGPRLIAAVTICLTSAYVFVGLRFLSRRIGNTKLAANDWLIVAALVNALVGALPSREKTMASAGWADDRIVGFRNDPRCLWLYGGRTRCRKACDLGHRSKDFGCRMFPISYKLDRHGSTY